MDGPGTITWEEFLENAESFIQMSDQISDQWQLQGDKNIPGQAYLVLRAKYFLPQNQDLEKLCALGDNNFDEELEFDLKEDSHEAASVVERPLCTEHHVLWSMSYSVPVLYFNAWKSDFPGINPVSAEEAQTLVEGTNLKYGELSQAIHPITGTPFLQLHPCLSRELLQNTNKSKNKLVSWLSTMAPAALNLKIKSDYCKLT